MIYRYNQDDECIEDDQLRVIGHPFATIDEGKEVKHERGRMIAEVLNLTGSEPKKTQEAGGEATPVPEPLGAIADFLLPVGIRQSLSLFQKKSLDRIERKHKKLVKKLIAKAAVEAAKGAA